MFESDCSDNIRKKYGSDVETVVEWSSSGRMLTVKLSTGKSFIRHEEEYFLNMTEEQAASLLEVEVQNMSACDETAFADYLDEYEIDFDDCENIVKLAWLEAFREHEGDIVANFVFHVACEA